MEIAASSEKIVKGAPFSADAVSESTQVLADGNRIVRSSTSKLHRNGEGRFRREFSNGSGGLLGGTYTFNSGVTILDPVVGHRYQIDPEARTAVQGELRRTMTIDTQRVVDLAASAAEKASKVRSVDVEKLRMEAPLAVVAPTEPSSHFVYTPSGSGGNVLMATGGMTKFETHTEQLGVQNIEGVDAEGTRTTTTIPAGAIGNERPIEVVYERWFSKELQLVVLSKQSDPRFGEQTYRLTNIVRAEPDPSLFSLPTGYRVFAGDRDATVVYREAITKEAEKAAKARGTGTTYVKTKP
jgi:hypothetical protein